MQIHELNTFSGEPGDLDFLPLDSGFDTSKISATDLLKSKLNKPTDNGQAGQLLRSKGDGGTEWSDVGLPTDAQTAQAVSDWLDAHPEATTTVQDGSLTIEKFALGTMGFVTPEMFGAEGDGVTDDTVAIQDAINYAISTSAWLEGMNKQYMVSDAVVLPPDISADEKGIYINGSLYMRNFRLVLKSDVSNLTSVLNVMNDVGDITILENIEINGNGTNQTQATTPIQDGGLHGIRIGQTETPSGKVLINNCKIQNCYTDGLLIRTATFDQMIVENTIITKNGRNGVTDNSYSSLLSNCVITYNGTRTAPKSGYHIEPDTAFDFGIKQIVGCKITNNVTMDFKIHCNSNAYNFEKVSVRDCEIGGFQWANYSISSCLHNHIEFINDWFKTAFSYYVNSFSVLSAFNNMIFDNCIFDTTMTIHGAADLSANRPKVAINNCKIVRLDIFKSFDQVILDKCSRDVIPISNIDAASTNVIYYGYYDSDTAHTKTINALTISNCLFYGINRFIELQNSDSIVKKISLVNNEFYIRATIIRAYCPIGSLFVLNNVINNYSTGLTVAIILQGTTSCVNMIGTNNISSLTEALTFRTSVVTNSVLANNLYEAAF